MKAVFLRELQNYFRTPLGYAFIGIFAAISGLVFMAGNILPQTQDYNSVMSNYMMIMVFLAPVLTMRLLSEERKTRSDQLLLTSPVTLPSIVLGKFFAAMCVYILTLAVTSVNVIVLQIYGAPAYPEIICGYVGLILMGACFIAVGLMISGLLENQFTAYLVTAVVFIFLWLMDILAPNVPNEFAYQVMTWLSLTKRYAAFRIGLLSLDAVLYYATFASVFLYMTVAVIDKRRWSEG